MDKYIRTGLKKIVQGIQLFEEDVELYIEDEKLVLDEYGKKDRSQNVKQIKMAIMTIKNRQTIYWTTIDNRNSILNNIKEAYYVLKETENFTISENDIIKYKDIKYRVNKVEENYDIFLRLELIEIDTTD